MIQFLGTMVALSMAIGAIFFVVGIVMFFIGENEEKKRRRRNGLD